MARQAMNRCVVGSREIAAIWPFDLDDTSAEVGELTRGERRGHRLFERDHGRAGERRRPVGRHQGRRCDASASTRRARSTTGSSTILPSSVVTAWPAARADS